MCESVKHLKPRTQTVSTSFRRVQLEGGVTSVTLRGEGRQFFVGTEASQMYRFNYVDFKEEVIATSHSSAVVDAAFPQ